MGWGKCIQAMIDLPAMEFAVPQGKTAGAFPG
jgi:hypothetical protein